MERNRRYPFLTLPEIRSIVPSLDVGLLAEVEDATNEIARFDVEHAVDMAPFAALLLRSEAAASSQIENLTASAKAIALAEMGDRSRHNASLIVANARAISAAQTGGGQRRRTWAAVEVLDALDAFAARAGRRARL